MEDAFLLVDSKMGTQKIHAKGGTTWAEEEARMIMWLFMELKREKRNSKTSTRTPPWLATLFQMMDDEKVGDDCDAEGMSVPEQMIYKRQQTLSSMSGSMSSASGTSSLAKLSAVPLSSSSSVPRGPWFTGFLNHNPSVWPLTLTPSTTTRSRVLP